MQFVNSSSSQRLWTYCYVASILVRELFAFYNTSFLLLLYISTFLWQCICHCNTLILTELHKQLLHMNNLKCHAIEDLQFPLVLCPNAKYRSHAPVPSPVPSSSPMSNSPVPMQVIHHNIIIFSHCSFF